MIQLRTILPVFLLVTAPVLGAVPRVTGVQPDAAKAGQEVEAKGVDLDSANVQNVYLTDGNNDHEVKISGQTGEAIKFEVPAVEPGYYRVMLLTAGANPAYLEQPVSCRVKGAEEPDEEAAPEQKLQIVDDPLAQEE